MEQNQIVATVTHVDQYGKWVQVSLSVSDDGTSYPLTHLPRRLFPDDVKRGDDILWTFEKWEQNQS
jgi:hypothetical protein